jgi:glycosyltransferase involved in cell wall biosynthesis
MKNVLILTYFFPPAPLAYSQRIGKLCKYLARESEWQPQVICGVLPWDILPGRDDALLGEIPESVTIEHVDSFLASKLATMLRVWHLYKPVGLIRKFLVTPDAYGDWVSRATATAEREYPQGKGIEALFACGPPNSAFLVGLHLSRRWRKPLVIDMRDPWSPIAANQHWLDRWYFRRTLPMETAVYDEASMIIVNTHGAASDLKRRFPHLGPKITIVPNGFDPEDLDWHEGPGLRQANEPEGTIHFLNLGGVRGGGVEAGFLKPLAAYLREKPDDREKIKVHFVGGTSQQVHQIVNPLGLADIAHAYGIVPSNKVGRPLAEADIYTLLQPKHHGFSVPSKFYYYLAGGGHIFAMIPETLALEVTEKLGNNQEIVEISDDSNSKDALARLIQRVRAAKQTGREALPSYAAPYDRRNLARQVAAVLDNVVAESIR